MILQNYLKYLAMGSFLLFSAQPAAAQKLKPLWNALNSSDEDIQSAALGKTVGEGILRDIPGNLSPIVSANGKIGHKAEKPTGIIEVRGQFITASLGAKQYLNNNPLNQERLLAEKDIERSKATIEVARRQKVAVLVQAFLEAIKIQDRINILKRSMVILKSQKDIIAERLRMRMKTLSDMERVNMQLDQRQVQILQSKIQLDDTLFTIKNLTRLNRVAIPELVDRDPARLIAKINAPSEDAQPPEVALLQAETNILKAQKEQLYSQFIPTASAFASLDYSKQMSSNLIEYLPIAKTSSMTFGLQLDWLIYDGNVTKVQEFKLAGQEQLNNTLIRNKLITDGIEKKRLQRIYDRSQKALAKSYSLVKSSEILLKSAESQFDAGLVDSDLVANSRTNITDAELAVSESVFTSLSAWMNLQLQRGRLNETMIDSIDNEWFKEGEAID